MNAFSDMTGPEHAWFAHRRHEAQLTLALEAAGAGTWEWDVASGEMSWSAEARRILGDTMPACSPSLQAFLDRIHPLDRERVASAMRSGADCGAAFEAESRVLGGDDVERWALIKGTASNDDEPRRMFGVLLDVTARHRMAQELRDLGGLIDVHERERRRLSRELHDGVSQRVGLLSAELALLRGQLDASPLILDQVDRLLAHTEEMGAELHRVSHDLHPAWLERAGLSASLRRLCTELSTAHRIAVHAEIAESSAGLASDAVLSSYRIVQEALHNVVKHSRASRVTVRLAFESGAMVLDVIDDGQGFALTERAMSGVGLISMRDRARHVGGHATVTSTPGAGTHVHVRVPLDGPASGS